MARELITPTSNLTPAAMPGFPRASHITHEHLLGVVLAELQAQGRSSVSILDAGCGDGHLMQYLDESLPALLPAARFEIYGFDVGDHGVQQQGFLDAAIARLHDQRAGIDWSARIRASSVQDPWPFEDEQFDVVVSNQVGEHVADLQAFLSENARVLKPGGFAVHLFPLRSSILEGHVLVPWAHRVRDHDLSRWWLRRATQLGIGKFRRERGAAARVEELAERHAEYLHLLTSYRGWREVAAAAAAADLRVTYRYTTDLYVRKWGSLRGRPLDRAARRRHPLIEALAFHLLKHVSSVTVLVTKATAFRG